MAHAGRVVASLRRRFFLRGHMTLILGATLGVAVVAHRALIDVHLHLAARLGLAVSAAYVAFFVLVRWWLWLISRADRPGELAEDVGEEVADAALDGAVGADLPDLGGDVVESPAFLALLVAIAVAVGGAVLLVWNAPIILGDAAFELALVAALGPRARLLSRPGWSGSVLRSTALPFGLLLFTAVVVGVGATLWCPAVVRLRDLLGPMCGG